MWRRKVAEAKQAAAQPVPASKLPAKKSNAD
jgi:hypothetical protein